MNIAPTLSGYLARTYIKNLFLLLLALLAILLLFDSVELLRRAADRSNVPLTMVLEMALLKLPEGGQVLLPFAVLYSAMFTFWQLTRRHELVVVRAAGFSVWQFLTPLIAVAVLAGALQMTVINPVSSLLVSRFEQMENKYLESNGMQVAVFREGLWLRQAADNGYVILHSPKIAQQNWMLQKPMALFFTGEDQFIKRIDAARARLLQGEWIFEDVSVQEPSGQNVQEQFILPTTLTRNDVEESFSSPSSMSFWRLPAHIQTLEETGFDPSRLRVHYQNLLSQPLLFAAMILLAASVAIRPPRTRGTFILLVAGVFLGFTLFFLSSFLQALGSTRQIPVILAAWAPAMIAFLIGLTVMMNLEDG